jgi:L-lactate dehydrogenase
MKIGIVGTGTVGCACAMAAVNRGSAREIVLVNRTRKTAEAVATDLRYGTPVTPKIEIVDGDYDALAGAGVVMITSGVNEKIAGTIAAPRPERRDLPRNYSANSARGADGRAAGCDGSSRSARRCRT